MAHKRTYTRVFEENGRLNAVAYMIDPGAEIMETASERFKASHNQLISNYLLTEQNGKPDMLPKEERVQKANEHMITLLNDIEEEVFSKLKENPFSKMITVEEVDERQKKLLGNLHDEAESLLAGLVDKHREKGLKSSYVSYIILSPHVESRMRELITEHGRNRRTEIRQRLRKRSSIQTNYKR